MSAARAAGIVAAAIAMMTTSNAQAPGDRPAANPRSTRSVVLGRNGMIAASQPLASAAGLKVLQDGGNAIDAAIATTANCAARRTDYLATTIVRFASVKTVYCVPAGIEAESPFFVAPIPSVSTPRAAA